jgi:hypothetical protein
MSQNYKIVIKDRNYNDWEIINNDNDNLLELKEKCNPITNKFFNNDIFCIDGTGEIILKSSPIKSNIYLPCILVIDKNKTYGKYKNKL